MTPKILIVDDDAAIRRLLQLALEDLEDEGVELLVAPDGEAALELVEEERPDLMVLDVMMPKMNGYDVCRAVRNKLGLKNIHIILLTAKGQQVDRIKGEEVGADLYMTKPFDPDELLNTVSQMLGFQAQ